jgi:hypothetical protein
MIRRLAALVALVALIAGACGSTAAPALTDPKDIVTKSIATIEAMKTFHLHAALTGTVKVDLTGSGTAAPIDLQGTTADVDVDIPNGNVKASFSAAALFVSGDLVKVGNDLYVKAAPIIPKYKKFPLDALTALIPIPSAVPSIAVPSVDPSAAIKQLTDALGKLSTPPIKAADEKIGDQDCYRVTIKISQADIAAAGAAAGASLPPQVSGAAIAISMDVWVRKSDLRPAQFAMAVDAGDQGNVSVILTLSNIDQAVTITAPPADQIDTSTP